MRTDCADADVRTLVESIETTEVAKWQLKSRVDWDATDGRNGRAQQTVWEISKAQEEDQGAVALVLDLAKASERVSLPRGLGLGNAFQFPKKDFASASRLFRAPEEGTVRRMCGRAVTDPARVQVGVLALAQDALSEVVNKKQPPLKKRQNEEFAEMAKKVMKKLKEEVEKKGLELSVSERARRCASIQ